ncbi:hypothetical protein PsorP6_000640 [Peronosclerospora sorghi]|uniref:Uncharacterized protein n=1 Tax=Peronosclerospora sorghi TaxID=230839 RepID=A0ACC0WUC0_9STRA|nr:hypothetical protein PsorP6_000640 [Peronosclerospora sorghi]
MWLGEMSELSKCWVKRQDYDPTQSFDVMGDEDVPPLVLRSKAQGRRSKGNLWCTAKGREEARKQKKKNAVVKAYSRRTI